MNLEKEPRWGFIRITVGRKIVDVNLQILLQTMEPNPFTYGRGWNKDFNMSNNALLAYANGMRPLRFWTKSELVELGANKKSTKKQIVEKIYDFIEGEFHHTKNYKKEYFVSAKNIRDAIIESQLDE